MRYSQLKAFHHVALLGGFSRAAEALFLSQPAISEQVRKLEQAHDVLLFTREHKRVQLTDAGEALFRLTRQFFEVEQQIGDFMSETGAAAAGELRIIADSAHHVTAILGQFRQRYPNISVTLRAGNTEDILKALRAYDAEIGIVGNPSPGRDMTTLNLGSTRIIAFAAHGLAPANDHGLSLRELAQLPLIFREIGSKTRQKLEDEAARQSIRLRPAIVAEGREAVRQLVASGAGIGVVSRAEFGNDPRLREIEIRDVDISMSEAMVHLTQRANVRVIRLFMGIARQMADQGFG